MSRPDLPESRNPLLEEERAPSHEILVERRCLGQTELKVKPGQVGTSNATKLENLGVLDYAHLRVPLPKDLTGSGIFMKGANRKWPEAYFLMRRSSDGFISATGMFKAAFPYSQVVEEAAEKDYIKSLREASSEEVAGNVWIDPGKALELADEYGIKLWIAALLDPEPITHGTSDSKKAIKSPPPYHMKEMANGVGRSPETKPTPAKGGTAGRRSARGTRSLRSESPTMEKPKTTPRKMATPRKPRKGRATTLEPVDEDSAVKNEAVNGNTVKVEIENTTVPDEKGEEQVESTKVNITMPADHPDMPIPNDSAEMMKRAKETVMEARKIDAQAPRTRKGKRKAEDMVEEDDEVGLEGPSSSTRPAKRPRAAELDLRKEKIRRRALAGIAGTLVLGLVSLYHNLTGWPH